MGKAVRWWLSGPAAGGGVPAPGGVAGQRAEGGEDGDAEGGREDGGGEHLLGGQALQVELDEDAEPWRPGREEQVADDGADHARARRGAQPVEDRRQRGRQVPPPRAYPAAELGGREQPAPLPLGGAQAGTRAGAEGGRAE